MNSYSSGIYHGNFAMEVATELESELDLLESMRFTAQNQGLHFLDPSGLDLHQKQTEEFVASTLNIPILRRHIPVQGNVMRKTYMKLLRHSTEYAFLTLVNRVDHSGSIRSHFRRASTRAGARLGAWHDAQPLLLEGESKWWHSAHILWLLATWSADEVIDSNLDVDPALYTATTRVLVNLWTPQYSTQQGYDAVTYTCAQLKEMWEEQGTRKAYSTTLSIGMFTYLACYDCLIRAGSVSQETDRVRDWTVAWYENLHQVRKVLSSLAERGCSFQEFVGVRGPNTGTDVPVLFLLLWYGRSLGISPRRICEIADRLHPAGGNFRGWLRDIMIVSGVGNDLADVERNLQEKSLNAVLCVYGQRTGTNPFAGKGLEQVELRQAYWYVVERYNEMVDNLLAEFRDEYKRVELGQSELFRDHKELLLAITALVDMCFATVYSGFVCKRYRAGALELIDMLGAAPIPVVKQRHVEAKLRTISGNYLG